VQIGGADHLPPEAALVPMLMQELADFINRDDPPKYDLLKMAISTIVFAGYTRSATAMAELSAC
jgi:Fic family protein